MGQKWSNRKKLEWRAAAAEYDTGMRFRIVQVSVKRKNRLGFWVEDQPHYGVQIGGSSTTLNFNEAWAYINGACAGARAARP